MNAPAAPEPVAAPPRDEMVDGTGRLRPLWGRLLGTIAQLGPEAMAARRRARDQIVAEEGAGALLPGRATAAGARRLDPIPLPLAAAEFAELEAGLAQRARLLDLVLRDVYGPQRLLAEGLLPAALVLANPAFLRPCRATDPGSWPGGQRLHLYAAELLRGPDGAWRVLADRTADAAGIGYALLNRRGLVRVMPELFAAAGANALRRLRPFFETWQDSLQRLAGPEANPGLALLSPGPSDKLWFEHVVLARELSCTLVEGGDLTARDGALWLKTLRGLRRVDLVIRRQDGRMVDPLELEPGAMHGVTGLLDAARWGGVRIVNDPGAGFAEAPALAAFLPALAEHLLGERLRLPAIPVLWLGDPASHARVLAEPGRWRLRPALDGTSPAVPPSGPAFAAVAARLAASPGEFAALATASPSLAPWATAEGMMAPQPVVLRLFLVHDGTDWRALPGGLARAVTEADLAGARLPLHALAKDVWVAAAEEEDAIRGPAHLAIAPLAIRRTAGDLPSRVADNFFWLGRYLERLEGAARLIRVAVQALERPEPTPRELAELRSLGDCLAAVDLLDAEEARAFGGAVAAGAPAAALLRIARHATPAGTPAGTRNSLPALLAEVSRLAGQLRDRLTMEVHDTITQGLRGLQEALLALPSARDERRGLEPLAQAMTAVLAFSAAVSGLAAENMVRGGGRMFLDLGRRIERAQAIAAELGRLLDQPGVAAQPARLEPGLRLALALRDSVITYRNRYLSAVQAAPVLDLVLADEGNPRGLAFQLAAARDLLAGLAEGGEAGDTAFASAAAALLAEAQAMVRDVAASPHSAAEAASALPPRLRALGEAIGVLSVAVSRRYFALLPAVHPLGVAAAEAEPALRGAA